jgi:hypothetical protein
MTGRISKRELVFKFEPSLAEDLRSDTMVPRNLIKLVVLSMMTRRELKLFTTSATTGGGGPATRACRLGPCFYILTTRSLPPQVPSESRAGTFEAVWREADSTKSLRKLANSVAWPHVDLAQ